MIIALLKRELFLSFTANGTAILGLVFFITVIFVSALGFDINSTDFNLIGPSLIWVTALLSVLLSAKNLIQDDFRDGSLDLLLISPIPLELVLALKAFAHWISISLPIILICPVISALFTIPFDNLLILIIGLFLGTPALSFIAILGASLTFSLRRSSILMPILIMPFYIPTLVFGVKIVNFTENTNEYHINGLLVLVAITLLSMSVLPFAAAMGVKSCLR